MRASGVGRVRLAARPRSLRDSSALDMMSIMVPVCAM